jgi:hypothetical protein
MAASRRFRVAARPPQAESLFGKAFITKNGLVTCTIAYRYRQAVLAFKRRDTMQICSKAAVLGHYVGDAHVPFHATQNYDGH